MTLVNGETFDSEINKITYSYIKDGGEAILGLLTNAGTYTITVSEYTVSYSLDNIYVGMVTITDNPGGNYTVSGTDSFEITKANQAKLTITGQPGSVVYGDAFTRGTSGGSGDGTVSWAVTTNHPATVDRDGKVTGVGAITITVQGMAPLDVALRFTVRPPVDSPYG